MAHGREHRVPLEGDEIDEPLPLHGKGAFSRLPIAAVYDPRITDAELRALAALAGSADRRGYSYVSHGLIARRLQTTRQNVQALLRKPVQLGYVEVNPRTRPNGGRAANVYRLVYPPLPDAPSTVPKRPRGRHRKSSSRMVTNQLQGQQGDVIASSQIDVIAHSP